MTEFQNSLLVVYQPHCARSHEPFGELLRRLGHECHVLESTWALQTDYDVGHVFQHIVQSGLPDPRDRFVVAPLAGPWRGTTANQLQNAFSTEPAGPAQRAQSGTAVRRRDSLDVEPLREDGEQQAGLIAGSAMRKASFP